MRGADGERLVTPDDIEDMRETGALFLTGRRTLYEAGRAYGRWEADNAICWHTSCVRCAGNLDQRAAGHFDGERTGLEQAIRALRESASTDPNTQATINVLIAKLERMRYVMDMGDLPGLLHGDIPGHAAP